MGGQRGHAAGSQENDDGLSLMALEFYTNRRLLRRIIFNLSHGFKTHSSCFLRPLMCCRNSNHNSNQFYFFFFFQLRDTWVGVDSENGHENDNNCVARLHAVTR